LGSFGASHQSWSIFDHGSNWMAQISVEDISSGQCVIIPEALALGRAGSLIREEAFLDNVNVGHVTKFSW
jgi:hypothetical protein